MGKLTELTQKCGSLSIQGNLAASSKSHNRPGCWEKNPIISPIQFPYVQIFFKFLLWNVNSLDKEILLNKIRYSPTKKGELLIFSYKLSGESFQIEKIKQVVSCRSTEMSSHSFLYPFLFCQWKGKEEPSDEFPFEELDKQKYELSVTYRE